MSLFEGFVVAFSMYSVIPMPKCEWTKDSMKYALCFFPLIGVVIAALIMLWDNISMQMYFSDFTFAIVATIIPILVSGAIHLDGFCDTVDALSSRKEMSEKRRILKDSHVGAFALIYIAIYLMLNVAMWYELRYYSKVVVLTGFVLSRALSAVTVLSFKAAGESGSMLSFKNGSEEENSLIVLFCFSIFCFGIIIGTNILFGLITSVAVCLLLVYYKQMSLKHFGGISGDLAGYFLCLCELLILLCSVFFGRGF